MERCPACGGQMRRPRQYLCKTCWYQLPPLTRVRLRESGDKEKARDRLFQLLSALRRDVPLDEIEVAA